MNSHKYSVLAANYLKEILMLMKKRHHLTFEEVAEILQISTRACQDIFKGRYSCGAATVLTFLALIPEEFALKVIRGFRQLILHKVEE